MVLLTKKKKRIFLFQNWICYKVNIFSKSTNCLQNKIKISNKKESKAKINKIKIIKEKKKSSSIFPDKSNYKLLPSHLNLVGFSNWTNFKSNIFRSNLFSGVPKQKYNTIPKREYSKKKNITFSRHDIWSFDGWNYLVALLIKKTQPFNQSNKNELRKGMHSPITLKSRLSSWHHFCIYALEILLFFARNKRLTIAPK